MGQMYVTFKTETFRIKTMYENTGWKRIISSQWPFDYN